ncbi:MAG: hypothetical protein ABEI27_11025 [Halobellus sp.]|uniref:hypothetical protein n=1 Tax=Halobellus sp. TaxID=1979212 RepID=UPI0035D4B575
MDGRTAISRLLTLAGVGPRDSLGGTEESAPYACVGCGATFDVQHHVCPECGGFSVEPQAERWGTQSD